MNSKTPFLNRWFAGLNALVVAGFALAAAVPTAHAASGTWTNLTSGGLWSDTGNWTNGIVADGTDATADFSTLDLTADNTVKLDSPRTIGNIKLGDTVTGTPAGWTLNNNSVATNVLTLAVFSGSPTITITSLSGSKNCTISAALAGNQGLTKAGVATLVLSNPTNSYTGDTTISGGGIQVSGALGSGTYNGNITNNGSLAFNSSVAQTLNGVISGTGSLTKNGATAGTLTLTQPNTFSGITSLATNFLGAVILNTNLALQNSALNVYAGGVKFPTVTLGSGVTSPTLGGLIGSADLASVITSGYTLCTNLTLNPGAGVSCSYTGAVANGASAMTLTKTGAGTQLLYGANTYSGNTIISGGTLKLSGSGSINNTTNIIVASGATFDVSTLTTALTLGASQTMKASATGGNTSGTNTVAAGENLTLSAGGLAFTAYGGGSTAPLTLAGTGGSLAMNSAPVIVTTTAALTNGSYKLVATNGSTTVTGTPGTLTVNGAASPSWASVAVTSGQLILTISGGMPAITAPATFPAALSAISGTASSPTSVAISGSGLTADITATAPTGLEVSKDNITYANTATFTQSGGTVSGTLYARLSSSAALGTYNSLNVVLSSAGAVSVNVATTASGNLVATSHWALAGSGNWGTATNWFASTIASGSGVTADFSQVDVTSDTTVHLDSSYTVGNLIFGNTDLSPAANWILDNNGSSGNTLTLAGGTPTVTVNNLGTGESATISAEIDGTNFTKAGIGTLTLAPGTATNTMGSLKNATGGLTLSNGTLNVTATGTPAGNGLWINGGTVTVAGGTLNANSGNVTVNGGGTLAVSSGTCSATGSSLLNGYGSAGTVTVSGTGLLIANLLRVTQYTVAPGGVVNLNGGTLQLNGFTYGNGVGTVNFNGSTVQARSAQTAFTVVTNNITYKVQAGGAIFDTTNYNITIGSPLVHDSSGPSLDGGLTKLGSGTLTLFNANTYTGNTTINAGNLQGAVGGSSASSTVILNASTATNGVLVTDNTKSWTCANLTAAAAGVLQFNFGVTPSTTVAPLVVTGAATFTATPTVSIVGTPPPGLGTYPLMSWGSQSGTAPSVVSVTTAFGQTASLSNSPTALYLVIADLPVSPTLNFSAATPGQLQFNWSGSYKLQWLTNTLSAGLQTNVSNGWVYYPNTNNPVIVTNRQTIPCVFFRLSQ